MKQFTTPITWQIEASDNDGDRAARRFLPQGAGHIRVEGTCTILHHAPRRWLWLDGDEHQIGRLQELAHDPHFQVTEITGYWCTIVLNEERDLRPLTSTQPIDRLLQGRGCAAMRLFDCPAIVSRSAEGLRILVRSSYVHSFLDVFSGEFAKRELKVAMT